MAERLPYIKLTIASDTVTGWRQIKMHWREIGCDGTTEFYDGYKVIQGRGELDKLADDLEAAAKFVRDWNEGDGRVTQVGIY